MLSTSESAFLAAYNTNDAFQTSVIITTWLQTLLKYAEALVQPKYAGALVLHH